MNAGMFSFFGHKLTVWMFGYGGVCVWGLLYVNDTGGAYLLALWLLDCHLPQCRFWIHSETEHLADNGETIPELHVFPLFLPPLWLIPYKCGTANPCLSLYAIAFE